MGGGSVDNSRALKERAWITAFLRGEKAEPKDHDWEAVFSICQGEGISPILYKIIEKQGAFEIPAVIQDHFKAAYLLNHFRNETFLNNLKDMLGLFQRQSIPVILLKGAALFTTLYEDPALRPMSDLDLLVHEENLEKAHRIFIDAGYLLNGKEYWPWWRKFGGERGFVRDDVLVELHWNLGGPDFPLSSVEVFPRAKKIVVSGAPALTLSPEDFLLFHLYHAVYRHAIFNLIWLMDIVKITTLWKEEIKWERFWKKAKALNFAPGASLGLKEAKEVLGAYVPQEILRDGVPYPKKLAWLINFMGKTELKGNLLTFMRVPGIKDKALFLLGVYFPSPSFLRLRYQVSKKVAWLYFFLRPFLVIAKALKALSRTGAAVLASITSRQERQEENSIASRKWGK
jgi:hypothetical protein